MKKKVIIIAIVSIIVALVGVMGYFNIIKPVVVTEAQIKIYSGEDVYKQVQRLNEEYKQDKVNETTIIHYMDDSVVSENVLDYRLILIDITWKNRSLLEKQTVDCYISEIQPNNIALYSEDIKTVFLVTKPFVEKNSEAKYAVSLGAYVRDCSKEELVEMLESISLYYMTEGEHTGRREGNIKLSDICDVSKIDFGE